MITGRRELTKCYWHISKEVPSLSDVGKNNQNLIVYRTFLESIQAYLQEFMSGIRKEDSKLSVSTTDLTDKERHEMLQMNFRGGLHSL